VSPERPTVVETGGRRLAVTNLDKVLYPETGFTKGDVIWYYAHVAPVMLPHLAQRPVTFTRYPNGVDGKSFFEKHVPASAPDWLPTVKVPRSSRGAGGAEGEPIEYCLLSEEAALAWSANLAALELHVPLWRSVVDGEYGPFDLMVFDLDPGAPADIVDCCTVAGWLREVLEADGYRAHPKTSGSKGLQLYVPLDPPRVWTDVHVEARRIAVDVERDHRDLVVSRQRRDLRPGKVLIDWSQNHAAKTTIAVYSLRARARPTASTPVRWDEVEACLEARDPALLQFEAGDVLERIELHGDLFAPLLAGAPHAKRATKRAPTGGSKPDTRPNAKPNARPNAKRTSKVDAKPNAKPKPKPKPKLKPKPS
jgi:bifunctional non-homologous end joining protein LigD